MSNSCIEPWEAEAYIMGIPITVEVYLDVFNNAEDYRLMSLLQNIFMSQEPAWIPSHNSAGDMYGHISHFKLAHPVDGRSTLTYTVHLREHPKSDTVRKDLVVCIDPSSIVKVCSYPMLTRQPHLTPARMGDVWDRYELGQLEVSGDLVLHLKRSWGTLECGTTVEVLLPDSLGGVTWRGIVLRWNYVRSDGCEPVTEIVLRPTGGPKLPNKPIKEDTTVKIFEAIVVKNTFVKGAEAMQPESVVKVTEPFVAETPRAARELVMVDYAKEANLTGKDLKEYTIIVREFCGAV